MSSKNNAATVCLSEADILQMSRSSTSMESIPAHPRDFKRQLDNNLQLCQARAMYIEWSLSQWQERYLNMPVIRRDSLGVRAGDRARCAAELDPFVSSPLKDMMASLNEMCVDIATALSGWELLRTQSLLETANRHLGRAERMLERAGEALQAHEREPWRIENAIDQLRVLSQTVGGFQGQYEELRTRYHRLRTRETSGHVGINHRVRCDLAFGNAADASNRCRSPYYEGRMRSIFDLCIQAIDSACVDHMQAVFRSAGEEAAEIKDWLDNLEQAVVAHEEIEVSTERSIYWQPVTEKALARVLMDSPRSATKAWLEGQAAPV